jgi:hypothetical protein
MDAISQSSIAGLREARRVKVRSQENLSGFGLTSFSRRAAAKRVSRCRGHDYAKDLPPNLDGCG